MIRIICCLWLALTVLNAAERTSLLQAFDNHDPRLTAGDELLNNCRLATIDPQVAAERSAALEGLLHETPDHPDRAMALYFLGLNRQVCEDWGGAASAFEQSLAAMPALAEMSAVEAYIAACQRRHLAAVGPWWSGAIAGLLITLGLIGCLTSRQDQLPWKRLMIAGGAALVAWLLLLALLPWIMGPPAESALDGYPTPVLVSSLLWETGSGHLLLLACYGAVAIVAGIILAAAASRLPRGRLPVGVPAACLVAVAVLGVGYFRHFHGRYRYRDSRLIFLDREIAWKHDVPEAMLPLFDEDFRARIIEAKRQRAAEQSRGESP